MTSAKSCSRATYYIAVRLRMKRSCYHFSDVSSQGTKLGLSGWSWIAVHSWSTGPHLNKSDRALPPSAPSVAFIHSFSYFPLSPSMILNYIWCRKWQNLSQWTPLLWKLCKRTTRFLFFSQFLQNVVVGTESRKSIKRNSVESSFSLLILWCDPYIMGIGFHRLFQAQTFTSPLSFRKAKRI